MISHLGQVLRRRLSADGLLGDTLLVRMRSVTIGLLGLVTAVGLGLVVLVMQQGWPSVFGGPLPPVPGPRFVHNETIPQPPLGGGGRSEAPAEPPVTSRPARPASARGLLVADSDPVEGAAEPPTPAPTPGSHQPTPKPEGSPPSPQQGTPTAPPTAPAEPPAAAPPTESTSKPAPTPVAAQAPDDSSGHFGGSPDHGWHPSGPPSWAGHGDHDYGGHDYGDHDYGGHDDGGHGHGGPSWSGGHGGGWSGN